MTGQRKTVRISRLFSSRKHFKITWFDHHYAASIYYVLYDQENDQFPILHSFPSSLDIQTVNYFAV